MQIVTEIIEYLKKLFFTKKNVFLLKLKQNCSIVKLLNCYFKMVKQLNLESTPKNPKRVTNPFGMYRF